MATTGTRLASAALGVTLGLTMVACSTAGTRDYCRYSQEYPIREADPESLALVLGVKSGRVKDTPFVVLRRLSANSPKAFVILHAAAAPHSLPMSLDESRCVAVDWSTYTLTVDSEEWYAFWRDDSASQFEIAIAFLDSNSEPLMASAFGAAIVDTAADDYLVSCGCYWK